VAAVKGENRKRVLAFGCGAVSTFLADPHQVAHAPARGEPPAPERLRALFKELFGRGERYNETGASTPPMLPREQESLVSVRRGRRGCRRSRCSALRARTAP